VRAPLEISVEVCSPFRYLSTLHLVLSSSKKASMTASSGALSLDTAASAVASSLDLSGCLWRISGKSVRSSTSSASALGILQGGRGVRAGL
jgi:hypothetical protein